MNKVLLLLFFILPTQVTAEPLWVPVSILVTGNVAEGWTTYRGITDGRGHEANPLLASVSPSGLFILKVSVSVPQALAVHILAKHGHPRAARILAYGISVAAFSLAWHNHNVAR